MTDPTRHTPDQEALREQAVTWHVRLGSDQAEEADWLAFEAWLGQSPAHAAAYAEVETLWMDLDDAAPATVAAEAPAADNVVAFRPRQRPKVEVWLGRMAAALMVTILAGVMWFNFPAPTQDYVTPRGERRVVTLADGTHITMNGGSHLTVRLGRHTREVTMADAEAVFDVAHDTSRPFLIQASDRQIRVVGTNFNVLNRGGDVRVTVRRGIVEVRPAGQPAAAPIARLTAGQGLAHRVGQSGDRVSADDPEVAFAWTEGRLIFRDQPLEDVASVLNRYADTPIVVAPDAREVRVTAVLTLDREDAMLRRLSEFLPVDVRRTPTSVEIGSARSGR